MKQRLGERWAHYVGQRALQQGLFPWLFVVLAIIWAVIGVQQLLRSRELETIFGIHTTIPLIVSASAWPFMSGSLLFYVVR
jgi:hypothetical protein